jgi:hypothetical protein
VGSRVRGDRGRGGGEQLAGVELHDLDVLEAKDSEGGDVAGTGVQVVQGRRTSLGEAGGPAAHGGRLVGG